MTCANCGNAIELDAAYCGNCGAQNSAASAASGSTSTWYAQSSPAPSTAPPEQQQQAAWGPPAQTGYAPPPNQPPAAAPAMPAPPPVAPQHYQQFPGYAPPPGQFAGPQGPVPMGYAGPRVGYAIPYPPRSSSMGLGIVAGLLFVLGAVRTVLVEFDGSVAALSSQFRSFGPFGIGPARGNASAEVLKDVAPGWTHVHWTAPLDLLEPWELTAVIAGSATFVLAFLAFFFSLARLPKVAGGLGLVLALSLAVGAIANASWMLDQNTGIGEGQFDPFRAIIIPSAVAGVFAITALALSIRALGSVPTRRSTF